MILLANTDAKLAAKSRSCVIFREGDLCTCVEKKGGGLDEGKKKKFQSYLTPNA